MMKVGTLAHNLARGIIRDKYFYGTSIILRNMSLHRKLPLDHESISFQFRTRHFSTFTRKYNKSGNDEPTKSQRGPAATKASLLAQANNAFSRAMVHIRWPLLRGSRNASKSDVISAFISSVVMGNILWIILGTTTFGLVTMHSLHYFDHLWFKLFPDNDDQKDEYSHWDDSILGHFTRSVLAQGLGVNIDFRKGHVLPEFKDGKLRFKNFKLRSSSKPGSQTFQADVEAMDITLSFKKWYEGSGVINDVEIFGLNGQIIRTNNIVQEPISVNGTPAPTPEGIHYQYDINDYNLEQSSSPEYVPTPKSLLDSNYQLEHVKIRDSYFEVFNDSTKSNPLKVTIFSCDLPKLRGDRVLIDFFNANNVSGALNDAMFTIHKRQNIYKGEEVEGEDSNKIVRFKLNGINLGAITKSRPYSKFNWLVNGKAEITADITIPSLNEEEFQIMDEYKRVSNAINEMISDFVSVTNPEIESKRDEECSQNTLLKGALTAIYQTFSKESTEPVSSKSDYVLVNVKIKFTDLAASLPQHLPLSSTGVPFISLQNLRSLIACVNTLFTGSPTVDPSQSNTTASHSGSGTMFSPHNPLVIKTTVIEKLTDLYNIENLGQTKIVDSIVSDVYEDLLKLVKANERQIISEKSNMWSHSIASQLLLLGLGVIV